MAAAFEHGADTFVARPLGRRSSHVRQLRFCRGRRANIFPQTIKGVRDLLSRFVAGAVSKFEMPKRQRQVGSDRSEEHTSELQSQSNLVCRLLLEKKKNDADFSTSIAIDFLRLLQPLRLLYTPLVHAPLSNIPLLLHIRLPLPIVTAPSF